MIMDDASPDPEPRFGELSMQGQPAGRVEAFEHKLRDRIGKWAEEIGYWGQASNIVVGEYIATDYSPPRATATFQLGPLSFHCIRDDATDEFEVHLDGSTIGHIADRAALDRAIQDSEHHGSEIA